MKMNSKRKRMVLLQNGESLKNKLKHLLIILSFLLLSSPVSGERKTNETLFGSPMNSFINTSNILGNTTQRTVQFCDSQMCYYKNQ